MPLFEYECKECKKTFELLVKNTNEKVSCPECGSKSVEKMMGHFAPLGSSSNKRLNMGCAEDTGYKCALKDSGGCCACGK
jgi:putative FmdB family regulatory protein